MRETRRRPACHGESGRRTIPISLSWEIAVKITERSLKWRPRARETNCPDASVLYMALSSKKYSFNRLVTGIQQGLILLASVVVNNEVRILRSHNHTIIAMIVPFRTSLHKDPRLCCVGKILAILTQYQWFLHDYSSLLELLRHLFLAMLDKITPTGVAKIRRHVF